MKNDAGSSPLHSGTGQLRQALKLPYLYCKKDLMKLYGISYKTLEAWLRPKASLIGPLKGRYYTRRQLLVIFELLGYPEDFSE